MIVRRNGGVLSALQVRSDAAAMMPPTPILRHGNWPLLEVTASMFEGKLATERAAGGASTAGAHPCSRHACDRLNVCVCTDSCALCDCSLTDFNCEVCFSKQMRCQLRKPLHQVKKSSCIYKVLTNRCRHSTCCL